MSERESDAGEGLDTLPQIDLRIPGPWRAPEELEEALAGAGGGYEVTDERLLHRPSGRRFHLGVSPHDDQIHEIFDGTGRLSKKDVNRIASHAVKVHVCGPGGSPDAARALMEAGTALVRAGGYGVMVDNSGNAHGVDDWLALAGDKQPGGLYWAYVSVTASRKEVFSAGMHCLGFRDGEMMEPEEMGAPSPQAAGMLLHNFLGYVYQSGMPVIDGDALGDEQSAMFRARARPCTRFPVDSSWYNPYGVWRLEALEGD